MLREKMEYQIEKQMLEFVSYSLVSILKDQYSNSPSNFELKQIDLMFNRRFNIEYIPYDIKRDDYFIELKDKTYISWFKIQSALNKIIKEHCHESKCIGYYFWNIYDEIENKRVIKFEEFKNKLVYHIYGSILNNFDNDYFYYNIKDEKK